MCLLTLGSLSASSLYSSVACAGEPDTKTWCAGTCIILQNDEVERSVAITSEGSNPALALQALNNKCSKVFSATPLHSHPRIYNEWMVGVKRAENWDEATFKNACTSLVELKKKMNFNSIFKYPDSPGNHQVNGSTDKEAKPKVVETEGARPDANNMGAITAQ